MHSKKTFIGFFIFFIALSCNQADENTNNDNKKDIAEKVEEYKKQIPDTNVDPKNDEWKDNLYRNKFYKFRVEFPKKWEYDKGSANITLARALNRDIGATIAVAVKHLSADSKKSNNINDVMPKESFEKSFTELTGLQNVVPEDFKIEDAFLNNFPAYIIQFKHKQSMGTQILTYFTKIIQCVYDSKIYQITLNIPVDFYNFEIKKIIKKVIEDFVFEIV